MLKVILSAVVFGMIFSLYSGALLAQTLRHGLQQGFVAAFWTQAGWLLGAAVWAVINPRGIPLMFDDPRVKLLPLIAIPYMVWLGLGSLRDAWRPPMVEEVPTAKKAFSALMVGLGLSMTSYLNVVNWAAIVSLLSDIVGHTPSRAEKLIFITGGVLTSVICCFAIAGVVHVLHKKMSNRWKRITYGACGVALICLAGWSLMDIL